RVRTVASVLWPVACPFLIAGAVLIMALSLVEVPATVLISPQRPQMLTPLMMTWVHMLRYDAMIEASLLLMSAVGVLGVVVAGLAVVAMKKSPSPGLSRSTGRGITAVLAAWGVVLMTGCFDGAKPSAIW